MPFIRKTPISRRTLLRSGAVALSLPLLDAMLPMASAAAAPVGHPATDAADSSGSPQRMVLIHRPLGTYHPYLVPEKVGPKYEATRYLKLLERHRGRFTVFSGMSHLGYPDSHHTEAVMFTGTPPEAIRRADDMHVGVSLDQVVAEKIGTQTRIGHLVLNSANCASLSWNRKGVPVPFERSRAQLFRQLFIDGTPQEVKQEIERLRRGRSILDGLRDQLKTLGRDVGAGDRERLEVLTVSIREAEERLQQDQTWASRPRPKVLATVKEFEQADHWVAAQQQWYALVHLALQTDSTRVIVLGLSEHNTQGQPDLSIGHHEASHHGKDPAKIEQLGRYEDKEYATFATFLDKLVASKETGQSLLDRTQVLFVSNLGDASPHTTHDLPVLLAGGGFKHQGHVGFDRRKGKNTPLTNLYVRMLQGMGVETDRFGTSTGLVREIG